MPRKQIMVTFGADDDDLYEAILRINDKLKIPMTDVLKNATRHVLLDDEEPMDSIRVMKGFCEADLRAASEAPLPA